MLSRPSGAHSRIAKFVTKPMPERRQLFKNCSLLSERAERHTAPVGGGGQSAPRRDNFRSRQNAG